VRALGARMQVGDKRYDGDGIQRLYDSDKYRCDGVCWIERYHGYRV